jgi:hypothetical protein
VAEAAFDPDQSALVVLQVDDLGQGCQRAALDEDVQLVVHQPGLALRNHVDVDLVQRIEEAVLPLGQNPLEFTVAEVQTELVAANPCAMKQDHGRTSFLAEWLS